MSVEELLRPRYKVIADYPGSIFKVGDILTVFKSVEECGEYKDNCYPVLNDYGQWDKYPVIFKPLQWWEERRLEEMPMYIRLNQNTVCKVKKHHTTRYDEFECADTKYNYAYSITTPAIEQEYNDYLTHA